MKLIIDIPDTLKNIADEADIKTFSHFMWSVQLMDAIKNGTPLDDSEAEKIEAVQSYCYHYGKKDALDKIRNEIANEKGTFSKEHYIRIIDKYIKE